VRDARADAFVAGGGGGTGAFVFCFERCASGIRVAFSATAVF
jgi:hypothetical protein